MHNTTKISTISPIKGHRDFYAQQRLYSNVHPSGSQSPTGNAPYHNRSIKMTDTLIPHSIDIGHCRIYFKYKNYLLCYQEEHPKSFKLYHCTDSWGEPCTLLSIDHFLSKTPFPTGATEIESSFRFWATSYATKDLAIQCIDYFERNEGIPTELEKAINDISREMICTIKRTFGSCFLYQVNPKGKRDTTCVPYEESTPVLNFGASFITPIQSENLVSLINSRLDSQATGNEDDRKLLRPIIKLAQDLGAIWLDWA